MSASFSIRNLHVLAYAAGFTEWVYKTPTAALDGLLAPGFFNPAADMLAGHDHIHVSANDGGMLLWVQSSTAQGGVVVKVMART
jgi:hypothetical protein